MKFSEQFCFHGITSSQWEAGPILVLVANTEVCRAFTEALAAAIVRVCGHYRIRGQLQLRDDSTNNLALAQNATVEVQRELTSFSIQHCTATRVLLVFRFSRDDPHLPKLSPVMLVIARIICEVSVILALDNRTARSEKLALHKKNDPELGSAYRAFASCHTRGEHLLQQQQFIHPAEMDCAKFKPRSRR
ncbi:MAG: hypothetical protein WA182_18765 [Candidatus Sulfotelmatobacter sp.]